MGSVGGSSLISVKNLIGERIRFSATFLRREVRKSSNKYMQNYPTLIFTNIHQVGGGYVGAQVSFSDGKWAEDLDLSGEGDKIEFDAKVGYSEYHEWRISLSRPTKAVKVEDGAKWRERQARIDAEIAARDKAGREKAWAKQQARYAAAAEREKSRREAQEIST